MKSIKLYPLDKRVVKTITMPGSKSYSNRALLIAALTDGVVKITNPLVSDDTDAMIDCLQKLGIKINSQKNYIEVVGSIKDIKGGNYDLDANLSANTIRFLLPILSFTPGSKILKGREGLNKRPIKELVDALNHLGAQIEYIEKKNYPPLKITSAKLKPQNIVLSGQTSSQYLSALLMTLPLLGEASITVQPGQISKPYIDMTIDCMGKFGVKVINKNYKNYTVAPNQKYKLDEYMVEGDFSSASYFFAIAALTNSMITLKNLNPDSLQADKKILTVFANMGSIVTSGANEIKIEGKGVKPVIVDMIDFPDQAQTLAVLAAFAKGKTELTGLQSLRIKETDRIESTQSGLEEMKVSTRSTVDTLSVYGHDPRSARIDSYGDQRTAMSFAIAGAKIEGMVIEDPDVVNKTFPGFWNTLSEIGIKTEEAA